QNRLSNESSLKYFLLGAFSTGFLLYGIALLYGTSGTTNIPDILGKLDALSASPIFWAGFGLFIAGIAFKIGGVPFHMWIPDVYQGAPTTVTGFMSTAAKAAAFSALIVSLPRQSHGVERISDVLALISA